MNSYLVIWTYAANHGSLILRADTPELAAAAVKGVFSSDFRERGTIYVAPVDEVTVFSHSEPGRLPELVSPPITRLG
jgi:hypothetical protein